MLVGIVLGCALYYLCQLVGLGDHLGPVIASGERATIGLTIFPYFVDLKHSGDLLAFAPTIFGGALALAIIASIDALLCTKLVTAPGEPRRDGDRMLLPTRHRQRRGRVLRRHHRRHQYRRQHR